MIVLTPWERVCFLVAQLGERPNEDLKVPTSLLGFGIEVADSATNASGEVFLQVLLLPFECVPETNASGRTKSIVMDAGTQARPSM